MIEDSGNKGRHIFFRFENPVKAKDARTLLEIILKLSEVDMPIELFPKQDKVNEGDFGNLIKLPLGIHKKSANKSYFMDFDTLEQISPDILSKIKSIKLPEIEYILTKFNYLLENKSYKNKPITNVKEYPCIDTILQGVKEGFRDNCLFNLGIYLLKIKKLPKEIAINSLIEWNKKNTPPLEEKLIYDKAEYIISSKYDFIGCDMDGMDKLCSNDCKIKADKSVNAPKAKQTSLLITENNIVEMVYSQEKGSLFAIYDKINDIITYSTEFYHKNNLYIPYSDENIRSGAILLPSEALEYGSDSELIHEIQNFIHKWVDLDPFDEKLCTYYPLFTYMADCFNVCPYLRLYGDYGSGKTTTLKVIGSLCYKAIICGGAITSSPIFRFIDRYKGTLVIDESDFKNSDLNDEIIKILNCGYTKDIPVLRSDVKGKGFEPTAYDCYSPKILATRNFWKDEALESRCITIKMRKRTRQDVPLNIDLDIFKPEALKIRNKLLMWRFKNYGKRRLNENLKVNGIEDRINQIMVPLLSIIEDDGLKDYLKKFMIDYNARIIRERGLTKECDILESICELWQSNEGMIYIKEITDKVNESYDEKDKLSSSQIGRLIKNKLKIDTYHSRSGNYMTVSKEYLEDLKRKYGIIDNP